MPLSENLVDTAPLPGSSLPQALKRFVSGTFRFRGRASPSEYWSWMFINIVVLALAQFLIPLLFSGRMPQPALLLGPFGSAIFANVHLFEVHQSDAPSSPVAAFFSIVAGVWLVATAIPGISVAVRRLHDSNLSGWWALLAVLPPGPLALLLLATRRPRSEGVRFDA